MRRNWLILGLALLLLGITVPTALAQSGVGDKVIFNQAYTLPAGERLNGNLAVFNGNVTLERNSVVAGDVVVLGGRIVADGAIRGNLAVFRGRATLGNAAVIDGDFISVASAVSQDPGAVIYGETLLGLRSLRLDNHGIPAPTLEVRSPFGQLTGLLERFLLWQLRTLGVSLLLALFGVVALLVAPKGVGRVASAAATQPAVSFGLGLLTLFVLLFAGALLLIACGLGLLVWLALLAGLTLGWIGVGLWVGQWLLTKLQVRTASSVAEMILGVFVITVLAGLPFCIGFFFWLILGSIGLGAVVQTRFGTQTAEEGRDSPAALPPAEPL